MSNNLDYGMLRARMEASVSTSYGAMTDCIWKGDVNGLKRILSDIHSTRRLNDDTYQALMQTAAKSGSVACFAYLQQYVAEPTLYSDALNSAAEKGHLTLVQHIAPLVDAYSQEEGLCMAVLYNRIDVVHHLLPLCNPKNQSSKFLAAAAAEGHTELFELLYPLSNPEDALRYIQRKFPTQPDHWAMLEQRIVRDKLLAVMPPDRSNKRSKI